jgi:hypothetical protein
MIQKEHFRGVVAVRSEQSRRVDWLLTLTRRVIEKSRPSFDWLSTQGHKDERNFSSLNCSI